MVNADISLTPF